MRFWTWAGIGFLAVSASAVELKSGVLVRDQFPAPFVRTVMAGAPRSIAIPLSSNLHVAFDAEKLGLHTVWSGDRLTAAGYATVGTQNPVAKPRGTILWTAPDESPWSARSNRFRGVSTKGGRATLLYDLGDARGWARVSETATALSMSNAVQRRFEIARGTDALRLLVFAGTNDVLLTNARAAVLKRAEGNLVITHRGAGEIQVQQTNGVRVSVALPGSVATNAQNFELTMALVPTNAAPAAAVDELARVSVVPAPKLPVIEFAGVTNAGRVDGDGFFRREQIPVPKELDLLVGGLDWLPNGDLMISTWPGDVFVARGVTNSLTNIIWRRFAAGLHEPLGVKWKDGSAYVASKAELSRITDTDGDGEADLFETVSDAWGFDGDPHYFAYGPAVDDAGNFYVPLDGNTGDWQARWNVPMRGWAVKVQPDGVTEPLACGLRSPNGVFTFAGNVFCTDNEGYWIGACKLDWLRKGKFFGYPSSTPHPRENFDKPTNCDPPALWFPRKLAPSASGGVAVNDPRFGPFTNQLFVGDFFTASLMRVQLEQVNGQWQGAVWPFMKSFLSGVNRVAPGPDGKLYVGCLKRGWSSSGPQDFALERITFTGKTPFEVREVHARPDGFELTFTEPAGASAADTNSWNVSQFTYRYHSKYGSPEVDHNGKDSSATPIAVTKAEVSADKLRVRLQFAGWKTNFVTAVKSSVTNSAGASLRNDTFYYTLNHIPR